MKSLVILLFCILYSSSFILLIVNGHTYHNGGCPSVEPMSGFEMRSFLGIWYAIQKTSTASPCIIYNITMGEEPGEYSIEQTSQHFGLSLTPIKHEYSYTGQISVPDNDLPAKMRVKFPLSVGGDSSFVVFMTDYQNYAGLFTCQSLKIAHRQSATLLSRTRTLDKIYIEKMRNRLSQSSVSPFSLSIINQTGCPKDPAETGYNIHIDENTFSAHNIANVFRKAGEKIGDGFEWTVDAGKKIYHKLSDNDHDDSIPPMMQPNARMTTINDNDPDAEWVRV